MLVRCSDPIDHLTLKAIGIFAEQRQTEILEYVSTSKSNIVLSYSAKVLENVTCTDDNIMFSVVGDDSGVTIVSSSSPTVSMAIGKTISMHLADFDDVTIMWILYLVDLDV